MSESGANWYRRKRRKRTPRAQSPLVNLTPESLDNSVNQHTTRRREYLHTGLAGNRPIDLSHILFLFMGVVLGAGFYALGGLVVGVQDYQNRPQPTPSRQAPISVPGTIQTFSPKPIHSSDPTVIVRAMLKASHAGQLELAYGYWAIEPRERALVGPNGMYATLEELTRQAANRPDVDLSSYVFEVHKRVGDTVRVGQYHHGVLICDFALRSAGDTWKLLTCTQP